MSTVRMDYWRGIEFCFANTPLLKTIYWKFAPNYYRHRIRKSINSRSPIDPLKVVDAPVEHISRFTGRRNPTKERWKDLGKIKSGAWDLTLRSELDHGRTKIVEKLSFGDYIEDTILFKSFRNHFAHDVSWEDTEFIQCYLDAVDSGIVCWHGCQSREDIYSRCEDMDQLYKSIKNMGYKTQFELFRNNKDMGYISYLDLLTDEVTVDIGREGELLFVDGRHRICIAKILGLDTIPVVILVRHPNWRAKRDRIYSSDECVVKTHPDMAEFAY